MPRLPQPGKDAGEWGTILNDFLLSSLSSDGTLKPNTVGSSQLQTGSVTAASLATGAVTTTALSDNAITTSKISDGSITAVKVAADVATRVELDAVASGKADAVHAHSAADVTSGTLPLARGGTGGTDAATARTSLGLGSAATMTPATLASDSAFVGAYGARRGSSFIAIGDSITAGGSSFVNNIHSEVWATHFALATGMRLVRNAGIGGNNTTQMLARFDTDVLAYDSDFVFIMAGTNDTLDGGNLPTVTAANITAMVAKIRDANRIPLLLTIPPAGTPLSPATATVLLKIATINGWIRRFAREQRIDLVDIYQAMTDSATGAWSAADMTSDGTHPTTKASKLMGQYAATKFGQRFAAADPSLLVYNSEPLNLVSNGCFLSMSGWVNYGGTGGSFTDTTPSDPGNVVGNWLQIVRTSPGDLRVHAEKTILPSVSTFQIGDVIEVAFRVSTANMEATGANRATLGVSVKCTGAVPGNITSLQLESDVTGVWIARGVVPVGTTNLTVQIVTNKQAGTPSYGPVRVGQIAVRNLTKIGALL